MVARQAYNLEEECLNPLRATIISVWNVEWDGGGITGTGGDTRALSKELGPVGSHMEWMHMIIIRGGSVILHMDEWSLLQTMGPLHYGEACLPATCLPACQLNPSSE